MRAPLVSLLALGFASLIPLAAHAQSASAMPAGTAPMDMSSMSGMTSTTTTHDAVALPSMTPHQAGMDMDMDDDAAFGMLRIDQLEAVHTRDGNGQAWEVEGWYGDDENKLWFRTEGSRSEQRLDDGDVEALWSHAISAFWDTQLGMRQDVGLGPSQTWGALGVQGTAPYNVELEATAYLGTSGRSATRLRGEYELRFTQRLILQPEAELNLYSHDAGAQRFGADLSSLQFGLRLRYAFDRRFAPYLGINWVRRLTSIDSTLPAYRQALVDRQIVAGFHFWF